MCNQSCTCFVGTVSELEERLDQMRIGASRVHYDSESEDTGSYTDRSSSVSEEPPSAFHQYIKGMVSTQTLSHLPVLNSLEF